MSKRSRGGESTVEGVPRLTVTALRLWPTAYTVWRRESETTDSTGTPRCCRRPPTPWCCIRRAEMIQINKSKDYLSGFCDASGSSKA